MNLKIIFDMQKKLDKTILETHHLTINDTRQKRIVAFLVELGEFANEHASFKYWKKHKDINRDAMIEEFVDGLHFVVSICLDAGLTGDHQFKPKIVSDDATEQLMASFCQASCLQGTPDKAKSKGLLETYLGNAVILEISESEIIDYYIAKNKINFKRVADNY